MDCKHLVFRVSYQPNIMFCSQFVYSILEFAGLNYFDQSPTNVRPSHFIELDYYRKLEFVYEISLNDANSSDRLNTYA